MAVPVLVGVLRGLLRSLLLGRGSVHRVQRRLSYPNGEQTVQPVGMGSPGFSAHYGRTRDIAMAHPAGRKSLAIVALR